MDEVSSYVRWTRRSSTARPTNRLFRLVLESHDGKAPVPISEEKHEPASDIDIALMEKLKVLDAAWPIRAADIGAPTAQVRFVPMD